MKGQHPLFSVARAGLYLLSFAAAFLDSKTKSPLSIPLAVFGAILIFAFAGTVAYLKLKEKAPEAWLWHFDVNPFWMPIWTVSCIEAISTSLLLYAMTGLYFHGISNDYCICLALSCGSYLAIGLLAFRSKNTSSNKEYDNKYLVKNGAISVYQKIFVALIVLILVLGGVVYYSSQSGPDDSGLFYAVQNYLRSKYGDEPRLVISSITYDAITPGSGTYSANFQWGTDTGNVRANYARGSDGKVLWSVTEGKPEKNGQDIKK